MALAFVMEHFYESITHKKETIFRLHNNTGLCTYTIALSSGDYTRKGLENVIKL